MNFCRQRTLDCVIQQYNIKIEKWKLKIIIQAVTLMRGPAGARGTHKRGL